jgi:Flp pilus assembly protein TadG
MFKSQNSHNESGFAIVEFAMMAPMFIAVMCLVLELSCYLMATTSLHSFVCAAAREYSQNETTSSVQLIEAARQSAPNISTDNITLSISDLQTNTTGYTHHFPNGNERQSYVTEKSACITATFTYSPLTFVGAIFANSQQEIEVHAQSYADVNNMNEEGLSKW